MSNARIIAILAAIGIVVYTTTYYAAKLVVKIVKKLMNHSM